MKQEQRQLYQFLKNLLNSVVKKKDALPFRIPKDISLMVVVDVENWITTKCKYKKNYI